MRRGDEKAAFQEAAELVANAAETAAFGDSAGEVAKAVRDKNAKALLPALRKQ